MKILLCSVPDGSIKESPQPLIPRTKLKKGMYSWSGKDNEHPTFPIGLLRIYAAMERSGYKGDIYDINNLRHADTDLIKNFKKIKPDVIGLGGPLSHCYPNMKRIIKIIRNLYPDVWIIVGGHITGSAHVVLKKNDVDVCVVGDGEICFVKLLDYIKKNYDRKKIDYKILNEIKGLAFLD